MILKDISQLFKVFVNTRCLSLLTCFTMTCSYTHIKFVDHTHLSTVLLFSLPDAPRLPTWFSFCFMCFICVSYHCNQMVSISLLYMSLGERLYIEVCDITPEENVIYPLPPLIAPWGGVKPLESLTGSNLYQGHFLHTPLE